MKIKNKFLRDTPSATLMIISLTLSLFVLINISELVDRMLSECKIQQKYNYTYEFTVDVTNICENGKELDTEELSDVFEKINRGNLSLINTYIGVDETMANSLAEILVVKNEKLKYVFNHKQTSETNWEIAVSNELMKYVKEEEGKYKIRILGKWCNVYDNFELRNMEDGRHDIILNLENTNLSLEKIVQNTFFFNANKIEMKLESDQDISKTYEELKESLEKSFNAKVEMGASENREDYNVVWNQSLKKVFLPVTFLFTIVNCIVVSDLWFSRRRHELLVRKAYGYGNKDLYLFILKEITKITIPAMVAACFMQLLYLLGKKEEFGDLNVGRIGIIVVGMMLIIIIATLIPMKRIEKKSLAEAFRE